MNKLFLLTAFFFISQSVLAQDYDFTGIKADKEERYELLEKIKREREYLDSLSYVRKLDSLGRLFDYVNTDTSSYLAFSVHVEHVPGEYDKLLNELSANGFNTSEGAIAFGYGFTLKKRRFIHEFDFNIIWGDKMKSDNREVVQVSGVNVSYIFGFDLLNTSKFSLFPFVTVHYQGTELEYTRNPASGQSYDNLLDLPADISHIALRKGAFRVGFGGEIDYYISKSNRAGGIILGFRYGMNQTVSEGNYKSEKHEVDYDPEITLRDSYFGLVIKFYGRTSFN
jgi:hypothetical protein